MLKKESITEIKKTWVKTAEHASIAKYRRALFPVEIVWENLWGSQRYSIECCINYPAPDDFEQRKKLKKPFDEITIMQFVTRIDLDHANANKSTVKESELHQVLFAVHKLIDVVFYPEDNFKAPFAGFVKRKAILDFESWRDDIFSRNGKWIQLHSCLTK